MDSISQLEKWRGGSEQKIIKSMTPFIIDLNSMTYIYMYVIPTKWLELGLWIKLCPLLPRKFYVYFTNKSPMIDYTYLWVPIPCSRLWCSQLSFPIFIYIYSIESRL